MLHARITAAPSGATGDYGQALAGITRAYLTTLQAITAQIDALAQQITEALHTHPDRDVFTSLPKAGTVRAARLLAEIGDARGRFPTPDSLACLAGVAPSTRESGKVRIVAFRWAVDKQLRDAVCDFAGDSRHANPWAADLYHKAKPAATTTPTPYASSPAPGSTSSGNAGPPTPPTPPTATAPSSASADKINHRRLDTGQLTRPAATQPVAARC